MSLTEQPRKPRESDSEIHQTKKGNLCQFDTDVNNCVPYNYGMVKTLRGNAKNVQDITQIKA
jgi:hypothetical protein